MQALCAALLLLTGVGALAIGRRPNVITILTDDQGFGDNGYYCENSTGLCALTPHMDYLATSPHSVIFHRFYSAAGVCSPTRAAILTGRTNQRDCIWSALTCDGENPAPTCSMGVDGSLPWTEFTTAKAARKAGLSTIHIGKWHLGDLWEKHLPEMNRKWRVASPGTAGFDEWHTTEAEVSSSMSNCGCFPVNHTGPVPPAPVEPLGPNCCHDLTPHGDKCVVGGGYESDWCYPCTDYFTPNASDPRGVSGLQDVSHKIPGDDSAFIVDTFEEFLGRQVAKDAPFYAHLCFHSIHEPHPAMPEFYHMYANDPDYLGTLTQMDTQFGRLLDLLQSHKADNGPHQGAERTNIRWSTMQLRQCKASIFEGGIRVPGVMYAPGLITSHINVTVPTFTGDFLPTIMALLGVKSDNPTWIMDGVNLLDIIKSPNGVRGKPIPLSWGGQNGVIDENLKIINRPSFGQCDSQAPYNETALEDYYLFDVVNDYHELIDLKTKQPAEWTRMKHLYDKALLSIHHSQVNETQCCDAPQPDSPEGRFACNLGGLHPPPPDADRRDIAPRDPSDRCTWYVDIGLDGADIATTLAMTKEECCGTCQEVDGCTGVDLSGGRCHLKTGKLKMQPRLGTVSCVPPSH